jgi:hypothetical protein
MNEKTCLWITKIFRKKKIYRYHNINVASIAHRFNVDYSTLTLEVWHNEDSPIYGVRWFIRTVKFEEFRIIITILKFEQILRLLTHPSRSRNIHTSYGHKLFALDQCLRIWKMHFFLFGYVQCLPLIILKLIWDNFIADRPSIVHVKMNGPQLFAQFCKANNVAIAWNWPFQTLFVHMVLNVQETVI